MKDTAPKGMGVIAVAAAFGLIAAVVAWVLFSYGFFGGLFIGLLIAAITAIVLLLGWREPAPGPQQKEDTSVDEPAQAPYTPAPEPEPEPAPEPTPAAAAPAPEPTPAPEPIAEPEPAPEPAAEEPVAADGKPQFLTEAREGGPDDLKQIKGVGPKLEIMLHGMGIFHFDQIASWREAEQKWVDENLEGFKGRATRDAWVEQAKTLAAGGETAFSKKVGKGGVY